MTLGIIGVLSAMTVPTLMQNYQRKSYVTQLHKVYNELQQAAQQYMTDRNAVNLREAGLTSNEALANFVKTYFKVINDCGAEQQPCFAESYKKISGDNLGQATTLPVNMTIASGVSLAFRVSNEETGNNNKVAVFDVDINGKQGPNITGRDIFVLGLFSNGIVDEYGLVSVPGDKDTREKLFNEICNSSDPNWYGCFGKILNDNWEMTY